jgi:hypothetical protein
MLFYVSLFIACVISAFLVLYLYHALADVGKAFYNVLLPSSKGNLTNHLGDVRVNSTVNGAQTPWGWKGNGHETRGSTLRSAAAKGASGLDGFLNNHANKTSSAAWPYREDKVELTGTAYKVKRTMTASKKSRPGTNSKQPWGW